MELNFGDDSSDKDKQMKSTFESSDDSSDKKEKKNDKKQAKKSLPLFKMLAGESIDKNKEKSQYLNNQENQEIGLLNIIRKAGESDKKQKEDESNVEELVIDSESDERPAVELDASPELEAPVEKISVEERAEIINSYINVGIEDSTHQLGRLEQDSREAAEEAASITFLESLKNKIELDNQVEDDDIQKIADEVSEQLEDDDNDEVIPADDNNPVIEQNLSDIENNLEQGDDSDNSNNPPAITPQSQPPRPPIPPVNQVGVGGGGVNVPPNGGGVGGNNPNYIPPAPVGPNAINNQTMEYSINRRRAGDFLVGGIIGYLIGKRRGRIKTENQLIPVQQKLEKQVTDLQSKLYQQEERVRQVAAAKFEKKVIIAAPENIQEEVSKSSQEQTEKTKYAENNQKVMSLENNRKEVPESDFQPKPEVEQKEKQLTQKSIEIISLPMLLDIAEDIKLGNLSLKKLYDNGEIDQAQLREVVKKYLRGERIDEVVGEYIGKKTDSRELIKEDLEKENTERPLSQSNEKQADEKLNSSKEHNNHSEVSSHQDVSQSDSQNINPLKQQDTKPSLTPIYVTAVMAVIVAVIIIILFT